MIEDDSNPKSLPSQPVHVSELASEPRNTAATDYKRHPVYSPSEWLLEFISSTLALGLLISIGIIFWYMDNKPLAAWRGRISLNATVSILATACATALMHGVSTFISQFRWLYFKKASRRLADFEVFDEASRGTWGAILLLTTIKWNLATVGAFITILRLAFSPFTQQVILIEQRDIISPADNVTFGYAHNYTRDIMGEMFNSGVGGIPQDSGMQSAIYRGLYGIATKEPFQCPGACRWTGVYISLGFRAECRNVTQETLQSTVCEDNPNPDLHICNMTTPGGLGFGTRHGYTDSATAFNMSASSLLDPTIGLEEDTFPEIARFAIYRDFSFTDKRELDFGVKNAWVLGSSTAGPLYATIHINETLINGTHVPALETTFADLLALGNFKSTALTSGWVQGNFDNQYLGIAAGLMGNVDLYARVDDMATAMTEYLRYGPNTLLARGETIHSKPYVSIRWGYFSVPIVTEALSILFAILSVFSNRRSRRIPLWKSSSIAVLACQHEERRGLLQGTGRDVNEIQADAEKAGVRLQ
ncbi:hypothetical protein BJX62DRAFT_230208 [Aspergillus germanicus]